MPVPLEVAGGAEDNPFASFFADVGAFATQGVDALVIRLGLVIAVDTAADKFDVCRKAGADAVVNPREGNVVDALLDLTDGEGVDTGDPVTVMLLD